MPMVKRRKYMRVLLTLGKPLIRFGMMGFRQHRILTRAVTHKRRLCPWDPNIQIPAHLWIHEGTRCAYIREFGIGWPVLCWLFLSSLKWTSDTSVVAPPSSPQRWHTLAP